MKHDTAATPSRDPLPLQSYQDGLVSQPYGSLRRIPSMLTLETRHESARLLNQVLADTMVLFTFYKKHHWLMRGHTFYQLHLLLDRHADEQLELIDQMAERVQMLGAVAISDPWHVAEMSKVERPPRGAEEVPDMLSRLIEAHMVVIEGASAAIQSTASNLDWTTNDLLVGDVLRTNEKQVWFLTEHLVQAPAVWPSSAASSTESSLEGTGSGHRSR